MPYFAAFSFRCSSPLCASRNALMSSANASSRSHCSTARARPPCQAHLPNGPCRRSGRSLKGGEGSFIELPAGRCRSAGGIELPANVHTSVGGQHHGGHFAAAVCCRRASLRPSVELPPDIDGRSTWSRTPWRGPVRRKHNASACSISDCCAGPGPL